MIDKKKSDYLIDIASETRYQNQTDEYYRSYTEWRMNENNRFGYKFVKDKREHTYVEGEGYEYKEASDAEKKALRNCATLTGGCMLVSALIRLAQTVFDSRTAQLMQNGTMILTGSASKSDIVHAFLLVGIKLLVYLSALLLFKAFIKLPRAVYFPKRTTRPAQILCLLGVIGGVAMLWYIVFVVNTYLVGTVIFALPITLFRCDNTLLNLLYVFIDCVLASFIKAVFFNGFLFQSLRQFGDSTAVFIISIIEGFTAMRISSVGAVFVLALLTALITFKTGSVIVGAASRIFVNLLFYGTRYFEFAFREGGSEPYLIVYVIFILGIAMFSIGRMMSMSDWDFNITTGETALKFREKIMLFFTAMPMIEWFAAVVVTQLYVILV